LSSSGYSEDIVPWSRQITNEIKIEGQIVFAFQINCLTSTRLEIFLHFDSSSCTSISKGTWATILHKFEFSIFNNTWESRIKFVTYEYFTTFVWHYSLSIIISKVLSLVSLCVCTLQPEFVLFSTNSYFTTIFSSGM